MLPWGNNVRFEHSDRNGVPVIFTQFWRLRKVIGAPASALMLPAVVVEWGEG